LILQHIYPECSKQLLLAALTHDAAEYYTGDIPFPAKQASPELKSVLDNLERQWEEQNGVHFDLHPEETYFLKLADTLSGMWYCIQQVREGKVNAKRPFRKWREAIAKQLNKWDGNEQQTGKAEEMLELFIREMEEL